MLTDGYGLAISTPSPASRDEYVEGCGLLLTLYPGAEQAFDAALAADPEFALAHVAKGRARQLAGDLDGARACLDAAAALEERLPAREASQVAVFRHLLASRADAALAAARLHLQDWPRDALVLSTCASQIGLIGLSGLAGRERDLADLLDSLAPAYGDDWWFAAHHGMALSEAGDRDAARPKLERSAAQNPRNPWLAHARAHLHYEDGEPRAAKAFMHAWLPNYPREGGLHGHLHWHLALSELEDGNVNEAFRLYTDAFASDPYPGPALIKLADATSFLWRAELAGHPPDPARWRAMRDFARMMFPRPGTAIADWHVALAEAADGDGDTLERRAREMEDLDRAGKYPSGPVVPALCRAFAAFRRQEYGTVIDTIAPVVEQRERIGGSRAQTDLVEYTLLSAYVAAGRLDDLRRQIAARRPRPIIVPVAGLPVGA